VDTEIRYLELVRSDLIDAGRRETGRDRAPLARRFRTRGVAIAAAGTIALAGVVGWWSTTGGLAGLVGNEAQPGSGGATGATGGGVPAAPMPYTPGEDPASMVGIGGNVIRAPAPTSDTDERIIRTAEISVVIPKDSFEDRFSKAVEVASSNGGFVSSSTTRVRSGDLRIRVPADNFDETLRALRALGDVKVQTIQGQDVTADYVDLQARLRIAESRREALLRLMDETKSVGQTIHVQNALDETQLRIEELQGQLRLLDDQVALASIRLQLAEEGVATPNAHTDNVFQRTADGFVGVVETIVVGLGYLLPIALLGLLVWFVVSRIRRRRAA
jgi:hypothetical protein